MILAYTQDISSTHETPVKVHGLVNRGQWFGKTWLIQITDGYWPLNLVVEADSVQDAIDELADSPRWSWNIDIDDPDDVTDDTHRAGNDSHPVDLDYVRVYRCRLDYFAPADSLDY